MFKNFLVSEYKAGWKDKGKEGRSVRSLLQNQSEK